MKYTIEAESVGEDSKTVFFTIQDNMDSLEIEIHSNDGRIHIDYSILDKLNKLISIKEQQELVRNI